ncbi:MAG: hypothetical protein ACR2PZ_26465 [Pseudomonadales bacterium]
MSLKRNTAAVVLGSLSSLAPLALWSWYDTPNLDWFLVSFVLGGMAYSLTSLVYLLLLLLPLHLALRKRGLVHGWLYGLIGILFGLLTFAAYDLFTGGWSPFRDYALIAIIGMLCSLVFWAIVRRQPIT